MTTSSGYYQKEAVRHFYAHCSFLAQRKPGGDLRVCSSAVSKLTKNLHYLGH